MERRIYIACLASYNNGVLHGRWIDADDADTMREEIAGILRESPYPNVEVDCDDCEGTGKCGESHTCSNCDGTGKVPSAEEWAVHDYDGIPSSFGEYPNLEKIAEYVQALDELEPDDAAIEAFTAWVDNESRDSYDADSFREAYAGTFDSLTDWAESFIDDTGMLSDVPENISRYFDFEAWGRDAQLGGDVWTSRGSEGLHVFWNN